MSVAREDPAPLPAEALGGRPGPRSVLFKVLSGMLSGGLLVLLFAAIIPQLADFSGVKQSLAQLSTAAVVALFLAALAIRVLLAEAYVVITPGLSFLRSLIAREASSAVSNIVPGPSGTAAQFVILRSWGVSVERFTRATLGVSVSTDVLIFAGPGVVFVVWAMLGMPAAADSEHTWAFGLIALIVSVLTVVIVAAVGRSERFAATLGRLGQNSVNPLRRLFGKPPVTTWPDACVALRKDTIDVLRDHWPGLMACVGGGYVLNGLLLVACIWACGVSERALPMSLGFLLYSVGRIFTVVAITPGGVGVVEIAYSAVYLAVLGDSAHDEVVAGVLVYRALTYLLPIITGAFAYLAWRWLRRRELKEAAENPAPA